MPVLGKRKGKSKFLPLLLVAALLQEALAPGPWEPWLLLGSTHKACLTRGSDLVLVTPQSGRGRGSPTQS